MKHLFIFSRYFLGAIFMFSGFVKAVDPFGTAFKFDDYFSAFGMEWFQQASMFFSLLLSTSEFIIGCSLFFNFFVKTGIKAASLFMIFFTLLTFILAIANPVSDCGCFGDAIVLTNWQTFFKNLVLLIPVALLYYNLHLSEKHKSKALSFIQLTFYLVFILGISYYGYARLPLLDFRPYKVGTYIPASMKIPADAPRDIYTTTVVYKKNNEIKEFALNSLPDSSWEWVETKNILVKKGYEPPIHDFAIVSTIGEDVTDLIIDYEGYVFLFISPDLEKADLKYLNRIAYFSGLASLNGHKFIGLTASNIDQINEFTAKFNLSFNFYNTDETTLKTIIRSNPGIMLLHRGTIIAKWPVSDLPPAEKLFSNMDSYLVNRAENHNRHLLIVLFVFSILFINNLVYKLFN